MPERSEDPAKRLGLEDVEDRVIVGVLDQHLKRVARALEGGETRADRRAEDHAVARHAHPGELGHDEEDERLAALLDDADQDVRGDVVRQHVHLRGPGHHDADGPSRQKTEQEGLGGELRLARQ